jgi:hypothetical protein
MKTVNTSRALALGVTAALAATAFPFTSASAALPTPDSLVASSQDGAFFQPADYAAGDITVQARAGANATDVDDSQDLSYTWTVQPFEAGAQPVVLPVAEQKTDLDGRFVVALPANAGPGRYTLDAELDLDGQGAKISADDVLTVSVGNASAVDGSTADIDGLGASTPGLVENGTLTVTAPDGTYGPADNAPDPVAGQVYTLAVDHGFFTTGEPTTTVKGAQVGNLPSTGTRFTGITDANGTLTFRTGIARDTGFDDDGIVAAKVAIVNGPNASASTTWNTGTEDDQPLNGRVAVQLSPRSEQDGPVNPTLAGNRTFYDVLALDQFGNRVGGVSLDVDYTGNLDDWDNSGDGFGATESNFANFGDIWVLSNEAGTIYANATWADAPQTLFSNTVGGITAGTKPATASAAATFYEIDFNASRYSMSSSVSDTVRVGTTVTQTVRAIDQQGNPIEGFQVRFLRFGPDTTNGDVVATKTTNALGEATYSFIGTRRGRATITAEITDGNRRRELNGSAAFGVAVNARLARTKGVSSGGRYDRLTVSATKVAAGARVNLYKVVKGKQKLVGSKKLGRKGTVAFAIRDRNRNAKTKYVARMRSTSTSMADQSRTVNVR